MKIITFSASKGGVGKTTLSFNYGSWLAQQGYKVLLIDTDYQANLSSTFDFFTTENTVFNIFTDGIIKLHEVADNLTLLPASPNLDQLETMLQSRVNKEFMMMMWMQDHRAMIDNFDFILIDTHPEFGTLTKNMIAVSDYVFVPIEPSEYGFNQSRNQFDIRMEKFRAEAVDFMTRKSVIDAKVYYIANRVKKNTKSSQAFIRVLSELDAVLALIPERELFNSSTILKMPIFDIPNSNKLLEDIVPEFNKILDRTKEN
ncbi:chromosome partitioning protein [Weissella oryzae SG25]|uniref:Chromosome partitioning protein n=1 Tax=Weissella oryzae (strain DSM 25784 / JCM 18191 / LMG 30913 / SG25) TaxID=1329250 RepID=A0A069CUR7_WEIOS|nr:ParA family protein [Weissella oryzae]GAK31550.1 chromosome partitioning protein [Weissella oryzae SG25]